MQKIMDPKYKVWFDELVSLAIAKKLTPHGRDMSPNGWKPYYDEGFTPDAALEEDIGGSYNTGR